MMIKEVAKGQKKANVTYTYKDKKKEPGNYT